MISQEQRKIIEVIIYRLDKAVTETRRKIPKGEMYSLEKIDDALIVQDSLKKFWNNPKDDRWIDI